MIKSYPRHINKYSHLSNKRVGWAELFVLLHEKCEEGGKKCSLHCVGWGPIIYYVSTCRGEGGVRKCKLLLIFSTKNMLP